MHKLINLRVSWLVGLCMVVSCGVASLQAFTAVDANAIFDSHTRAFYQVTNGLAWHTKTTDGGRADYWMQAEQLDSSAVVMMQVTDPTETAHPESK